MRKGQRLFGSLWRVFTFVVIGASPLAAQGEIETKDRF